MAPVIQSGEGRQSVKKIDTAKLQGKGSYIKFSRLTYGESKRLQVENKEHQGDEVWQLEQSEELLKTHIVEWNWKDDDGQALPLPKDDEGVLDRLTDEEIEFLSSLFQPTDPKA